MWKDAAVCLVLLALQAQGGAGGEPLPAPSNWAQAMAGAGLGQLVRMGSAAEGWDLCSGSVEPSADPGGRGEAAAKSESPGVF